MAEKNALDLPSVSVVLPNYNHAHYLPGALEAILAQSVSPLEVIVVDDGSTDGSVEIIRKFAAHDSRIRFVANDGNRGVIFSANRGAALARGDFLYFASSDDRVQARFLERSLALLSANPQARLSCCDQSFLDPESGQLFPKHVPLADEPRYLSPSLLTQRLRGVHEQICASGTLIHRETLASLGGFYDELRWHSDWFVTLVIAFRHGMCFVPEPLTAFRLIGQGYSSGARRWQDQQRVLRRLLDYLASPAFADVARAFHRSRALATFGIGIVRVALADREHRRALRQLPLGAIAWRELKNVLIRFGPAALRRAFWTARYRWRAHQLHSARTARGGPDCATALPTRAARDAR